MSEDDAIAKAQATGPEDRIVAAAWLPRGFDESIDRSIQRSDTNVERLQYEHDPSSHSGQGHCLGAGGEPVPRRSALSRVRPYGYEWFVEIREKACRWQADGSRRPLQMKNPRLRPGPFFLSRELRCISQTATSP